MAFVGTMKKIIKWLVPYGCYQIYKQWKYEEKARQDRIVKNNKIRTYFSTLASNEQDPEILEIIDYFKNNAFSVFPYEFTKRYDPERN